MVWVFMCLDLFWMVTRFYVLSRLVVYLSFLVFDTLLHCWVWFDLFVVWLGWVVGLFVIRLGGLGWLFGWVLWVVVYDGLVLLILCISMLLRGCLDFVVLIYFVRVGCYGCGLVLVVVVGMLV